MADIRAFKALRPRKDLTSTIASLPYDVFNKEEARSYALSHKGCFLAIDRPETFFPEDYDMYAREVYEKGRDELNKEISEGKYVQDEKESFYLYEQDFKGRVQRGIAAVSSIDDYVNGIIKKHENTREEKERDRIRHVDILDAQTGPIFLCYRKREDLSELINEISKREPFVSFEGQDGTKNRIFVIDNDDEIERITKAFNDTEAIYIADGHHRCASAVKVGLKRREEGRSNRESDYFLSILFADDELEIMDYNRVVKDLNGLGTEDFLAEVSKKYDISGASSAVKPKSKGEVGLFVGGKWYKMTARADILSDDPVEGLDASILQNEVLAPILGIKDPRTDNRIDFVGGIRGLEELERRCRTDCKIAFALYPTSISELFKVADSNLLMPPKSTWFEPKLLSGLFIHSLK